MTADEKLIHWLKKLERHLEPDPSAGLVRSASERIRVLAAEMDRYKIALQVIAVWANNTPPSRPDIEARAMKALLGEGEQ
jgi:hypothetical protein